MLPVDEIDPLLEETTPDSSTRKPRSRRSSRTVVDYTEDPLLQDGPRSEMREDEPPAVQRAVGLAVASGVSAFR